MFPIFDRLGIPWNASSECLFPAPCHALKVQGAWGGWRPQRRWWAWLDSQSLTSSNPYVLIGAACMIGNLSINFSKFCRKVNFHEQKLSLRTRQYFGKLWKRSTLGFNILVAIFSSLLCKANCNIAHSCTNWLCNSSLSCHPCPFSQF